MYYPYIEQFRTALVEWFEREQRDLPWRHTKEPYKIWVSEVMLQQTRVDTVIPYYNRFLEKFPTMQSFAYAPEEDILKMWEGLGYYSRVRNLQAGVREVVETYNGIVPNNRHDISKLKGIGPYTAGAILSIAYGVPEHAVDGNVMRVLSRVLHIEEDIAVPKTKKTFEQAVMMLIDEDRTSSFNQGLMELGALICTPTSPKCLLCPVREYCTAFDKGIQESLPIKTKKTKMKHLYLDVVVGKTIDGKYIMEKRSDSGLLAGMWQFPMFETSEVETTQKSFEQQYNMKTNGNLQFAMTLKHVFSHITWHLTVYEIAVDSSSNALTPEHIEMLPLPVPMQKIWQYIYGETLLEF